MNQEHDDYGEPTGADDGGPSDGTLAFVLVVAAVLMWGLISVLWKLCQDGMR